MVRLDNMFVKHGCIVHITLFPLVISEAKSFLKGGEYNTRKYNIKDKKIKELELNIGVKMKILVTMEFFYRSSTGTSVMKFWSFSIYNLLATKTICESYGSLKF